MIAPAGRRLGKYEIRRKLGRGGMADVYLAEDTEAGCAVALKLIEHSADADTRDAIDAERRGAELQARLAATEPRVTRVYDAGDRDGFFFIAMEYIDGQDLAELMRRGPLAAEFAADVAIAVARALESAHSLEASIGGREFKGIVHGDIKPKNVRITSFGEVRILDFGIAKALALSRRLTRNEFGSVPYASPERLETGEVDAQSDLWSLAVMLYEMASGRQPYQAESTGKLERAIRSRIPPPPAPGPCPEPLRRILMKALAPDPRQRYASAGDLAADLEAFRAGAPVRAGAEDLDATRRTFRPASPESAATREPGRPVTWPPGKRGLAWRSWSMGLRVVAALAGLCLLAGLWHVAANYRLYRAGKAFERRIQAEQLTDPDEIWREWTELSGSNPSSVLLSGPRRTVRARLVEAASRVIALFRNGEAQPVKDWEHARAMLGEALALDPDDTVRGELRLSEGHIARIAGLYRHDGKELATALERFTEAKQLMPRSPDPELGLAQLYVYGMKDLDKAYDALHEAQKLGHPLGNREKQQLADGYLDRAGQLLSDALSVRGLPREKDQTERAAADYQRALELYRSVAPYGHATKSAALAESGLDGANSRLAQIAAGN
jgi:tetratricopeptide (TPR) repeat protein/predicted Ser/Thr protein kinase